MIYRDSTADPDAACGVKHRVARRPRRTAEQNRSRSCAPPRLEFATHGLAGARISRIVQKAGTNPRMIYEHFGSKSALYVADA